VSGGRARKMTNGSRAGVRRFALAGAVAVAMALPGLATAADEDEFERFKRQAEQGVSDIQQEFRKAVAEEDRQFTEHLRTQWAEFQAFRKNRDMGPKPRVLPVAPPVAAVPPANPPRPSKSGPTRPKTDLSAKPGPSAAPKPQAVEIPPPRASEAPAPRTTPKSAQTPPARTPEVPSPRTADIPAPPEPVAPQGKPSDGGKSARTEPDTPPPPRASLPDAPVAVPVPAPVSPPPPPPIAKPTPAPAPAATDSVAIDFYGTPVRVAVDSSWRSGAAVQTNPNGLASYWDRMSASNFQPTLDAVAQARRSMALDDWGHALLWQEVARALRPTAQREQLLLLWFFLVKSGFDARPGYSDTRLLLLVNVRQSVYGVNFIKVDDKPYYELFVPADGNANGRYAAYSGRYPAALRAIDIKAAATGFATAGAAQRSLEFDNRGKRVRFDVVYERPLTQYLERFPQLDFELYFTTPPSPSAKRSLADALAPHLKGLNEEESVNLLLAFVQKAFQYKTDKDQFGREKYFFVEEVLHFPYSDCEDRSVMFSWLVQELLGLDTVGLHYPGHMTTAVALPSVRGEWQTVDWRGKRFVIADPTYINASVGMAMPSYRGTKPLRVVEMR
jgi:hypothetical protein